MHTDFTATGSASLQPPARLTVYPNFANSAATRSRMSP
jgi:hypothetical protein